jgi:hypothetical protein
VKQGVGEIQALSRETERRTFLFKFMNQLLSNTESAAKALVERVEKYNIGNIQGEGVTKVTLQIVSTINRLKKIGKLPRDMTTTLLTIMQTSSFDEFNKVFAAIEVKKTLDALISHLLCMLNVLTKQQMTFCQSLRHST